MQSPQASHNPPPLSLNAAALATPPPGHLPTSQSPASAISPTIYEKNRRLINFFQLLIVLSCVAFMFLLRNAIAATVVSTLDLIFAVDLAERPPLGCRTQTFGDAVTMIVILFHHELTLLLCFLTAVAVDCLVCWLIRLAFCSSNSDTTFLSVLTSQQQQHHHQQPPALSPSKKKQRHANQQQQQQQLQQQQHQQQPQQQQTLAPWPLSPTIAATPSPATAGGNNASPPKAVEAATHETVSERVLQVIPEGIQARTVVAVIILLLVGVDLGEANTRFMSLSFSQPISKSTPHPQWRKGSAASTKSALRSGLESSGNRNQQPMTTSSTTNNKQRQQQQQQQQQTMKTTTATRKKKKKSTKTTGREPSMFVGAPRFIVRNSHLECELSHAIRRPGLVIVSGPRGVGKSVSARLIISNRSGFYCDVHRAATAATLEIQIEKCIEQHNLLNHVPSAWQSLSLAVRHFLANWLWKIMWYDHLAAAFHVATYWSSSSCSAKTSTTSNIRADMNDASESQPLPHNSNNNFVSYFCSFFFLSSSSSSSWPFIMFPSSSSHNASAPGIDNSAFLVSDPEFLAKRCFVNQQQQQEHGADDSNDEGEGEADKTPAPPPEPLLFVLDGVRDSSDGSLGLLDQAPNVLGAMQKIADIATIVIVAASDETLNDVHELPHLQFLSGLSSRVAFVTASPAELHEVSKLYAIFGRRSLAGACSRDIECAREVFGGAFEFTRQWANLLHPCPVADKSQLHRFCNSALRNVVAAAYAQMDATSGWRLGDHGDIDILSGSSSAKHDLMYRLRALHFMMQIASNDNDDEMLLPSASSTAHRESEDDASSLDQTDSSSSNHNKVVSITSCDQDVLEKFVKAQLVYEETVQFPMCRLHKQFNRKYYATLAMEQQNSVEESTSNRNNEDESVDDEDEDEEGDDDDDAPRVLDVDSEVTHSLKKQDTSITKNAEKSTNTAPKFGVVKRFGDVEGRRNLNDDAADNERGSSSTLQQQQHHQYDEYIEYDDMCFFGYQEHAGTVIRAVAPRLFNISLSRLLDSKKNLIEQSFEVLVEECLMRQRKLDKRTSKETTTTTTDCNNSETKSSSDSQGCSKWVNRFISSLKRRIAAHKAWEATDPSMKALSRTCGKALQL